jgi:hypothetical protein
MRFRGIDFPPASMIVDNFDVMRAVCSPRETNAPLAIDPHTVLPLAFAAERFETIAWDADQIHKRYCIVEHLKAPFSLPSE